MPSKNLFLICTFFVVLFLYKIDAGLAAEINDPGESTLNEASVVDFADVSLGSYASFTADGVTFEAIGGNGVWDVVTGYSGQYGMVGAHIQNSYGNTPSLKVVFSEEVDAFGFSWGAHNADWTLTAYDSGDNVLESRLLPYELDFTSFYGIATSGISYFVLTDPSLLDWVLLDNLYYTGFGVSFDALPATPNQRILLAHLNDELTGASGDFLADLTILAGLSGDEFRSALDALSPEPYIGLRDAGLRIARSGSTSVTERLQTLRLAQLAGIDPDQLYAASNAVMSDAPMVVGSGRQGGFGIWLKPYIFVADQDGEDSYFGYTHDSIGLSLGADYTLANGLIVGVLAGYADGTVDYGTVDAETEMASTYLGLYASSVFGNFHLHGQAAWYMHQFDTNRDLDFVGRTAKSEHDADELVATLGCEYLGLQPGGWNVVPGLAVIFSSYDEEGFEESGAGSFNLEGDHVNDETLSSRLGVRINRTFDFGGAAFIPEFKAAWAHDFHDADRDVTARFAGSQGDAFTIEGVEPDRDSLLVGVGANFVGDAMSVFFNYDSEISSEYWSWGLSAGIRYDF